MLCFVKCHKAFMNLPDLLPIWLWKPHSNYLEQMVKVARGSALACMESQGHNDSVSVLHSGSVLSGWRDVRDWFCSSVPITLSILVSCPPNSGWYGDHRKEEAKVIVYGRNMSSETKYFWQIWRFWSCISNSHLGFWEVCTGIKSLAIVCPQEKSKA